MGVKGLVEDLLDYVPVLLYQVCISGVWGMCIPGVYRRSVGHVYLAGCVLSHMGLMHGCQGAGGGPAGLRARAAVSGGLGHVY